MRNESIKLTMYFVVLTVKPWSATIVLEDHLAAPCSIAVECHILVSCAGVYVHTLWLPLLACTAPPAAAWIPVVVEICGCLTTIFLKLVYDHTSLGRNQHLTLEVELDVQQQGQADVENQLQPDKSQRQLPAVPEPQYQQVAGETQQQQQKQQLLSSPNTPCTHVPPKLRQRLVTKKRVVLNAPLTAAEAAEAAAAVASGDILLTMGLQLPAASAAAVATASYAASLSGATSAATSLAPTPKGNGPGGTVFYDSEKTTPRLGSRTASVRKVPWWLQTGISHHSVVPPSPRPAAAAPAPTACCPTCGAVQQLQQQQQQVLSSCRSIGRGLSNVARPSSKAFGNALFSPSPAVTPRATGNFTIKRQWSLFSREAAPAAAASQQGGCNAGDGLPAAPGGLSNRCDSPAGTPGAAAVRSARRQWSLLLQEAANQATANAAAAADGWALDSSSGTQSVTAGCIPGEERSSRV